MHLIGEDVLQCPFNPFFKWPPSHRAIKFLTEATGKFKATISMNEEFYVFAKMIPDQPGEFINFNMCFIYIQKPWNGEMAINM